VRICLWRNGGSFWRWCPREVVVALFVWMEVSVGVWVVALFVRVMAEVWRKLFVETVERLVVMVSLFVWVEVSVGVWMVALFVRVAVEVWVGN
jgi:hypothetical protein